LFGRPGHPAEADANRAAGPGPVGPSVAAGGVVQLLGDDAQQVLNVTNPVGVLAQGFTKGFLDGAKSKIPPGTWDTLNKELSGTANMLLFEAGATAGIVVGAAKDVWDLVVGLFHLAGLAIEFSPLGIAYSEAKAGIQGKPSPMVERYKLAKSLAFGLGEFVLAVKKDPQFLLKSGEGFGKVVGEKAGEWVIDKYMAKTPFYKGFDVGVVIGYLALEVAMLFVGPEVIAGKAISAAAKAAKGTEFGRVILALIEKVPSLAKLLEARKVGQGLAEGEKGIQAGAEVE
jgi:hypothetical protein